MCIIIIMTSQRKMGLKKGLIHMQQNLAYNHNHTITWLRREAAYLLKSKLKFLISRNVNELISPRLDKLATSFEDHARLGPNTIARFISVILFTSLLAATWGGDVMTTAPWQQQTPPRSTHVHWKVLSSNGLNKWLLYGFKLLITWWLL